MSENLIKRKIGLTSLPTDLLLFITVFIAQMFNMMVVTLCCMDVEAAAAISLYTLYD